MCGISARTRALNEHKPINFLVHCPAGIMLMMIRLIGNQNYDGSRKTSLSARGEGLAGLRGEGSASISGMGTLWIRDHHGDAHIEVRGAGLRTALPSGWIRYTNFRGAAHISGSQITVGLSGTNIRLTALGCGDFALRGSGSYRLGDAMQTEWTPRVQVISLSP